MIDDFTLRRLRNLERIAKDSSIPFNLLQQALTRFLIDVGYTRTPYQINMPIVFRARAKHFGSIEEACNYFNHADRLNYPNSNPDLPKVKLSWGRCNGPDESVFYCSDENIIPMFEVRPSKGDYLVTAQYSYILKDRIPLILPVIGVREIHQSFTNNQSNDNLANILSKDMHFTQGASEEILAIDQYFADWFTKVVDESCQHYYKLTTALYQCFTKNAKLESGRRFCGLIYPSVAGEQSGINIALETGFVDAHLYFQGAVICKIEDFDPVTRCYTTQPLKQLTQIRSNGQFDWADDPNSNCRPRFCPDTPTERFDIEDVPSFLSGIDIHERHYEAKQ